MFDIISLYCSLLPSFVISFLESPKCWLLLVEPSLLYQLWSLHFISSFRLSSVKIEESVIWRRTFSRVIVWFKSHLIHWFLLSGEGARELTWIWTISRLFLDGLNSQLFSLISCIVSEWSKALIFWLFIFFIHRVHIVISDLFSSSSFKSLFSNKCPIFTIFFKSIS